MSFIKKPNLPKSKVKTAIISNIDKKIIDFIKTYKIELFYTTENNSIDHSISKHADINTFYCGNRKIILDSSQKELKCILESRGANVAFSHKPVSGSYPEDCKLNCAVYGNKIITRVDSTDKSIINNYMSSQIISVKQGYARCSVCMLNENAIITDDPSIYKACLNQQFKVLLIDKGDILLPGHDYGFIGGASSLIDKNKVLFFGDVTKHKDFKKIDLFFKENGCKYDFIPGYALTDIGGMVLIEEE